MSKGQWYLICTSPFFGTRKCTVPESGAKHHCWKIRKGVFRNKAELLLYETIAQRHQKITKTFQLFVD